LHTLKIIGEVRSFHGLASFYRIFVQKFSTIVAPLKELVKKDIPFLWDDKPENSFKTLRDKLTHAPILRLSNFSKTFELECDACGVGILSIAYSNEKLRGSTLNYSTYDKELYAMICVLKTWEHYLVTNEFIFHINHDSVKYIRGRQN